MSSKNLCLKGLFPSSAKPTTAQLASLAIALSKRVKPKKPDALVKEAWAIWEAADKLLSQLQPPAPATRPKAAVSKPSSPEPKHYPVKLDNFLILMLPDLKGRTGDKNFIFRQYLEYRSRNQDQHRTRHNMFSEEDEGDPVPPEPAPGDLGQQFAHWRTHPIPDRESFRYHAWEFRNWYDKVYRPGHRAAASAAKANNAFKRRVGERLRNFLWEKSKGLNGEIPLAGFPKPTSEQMKQLLQLNSSMELKDYRNWNYDISA